MSHLQRFPVWDLNPGRRSPTRFQGMSGLFRSLGRRIEDEDNDKDD